MNQEFDRRSFLLGVSALAALCPIELRAPLQAGPASRVARSKLDRYTIDLANADRRLDVYNVRLRNYASAGKTPTIPGPLLETRGGHTLRVTLRNRITKADGVIDGDMAHAPKGLDPHNNPHDFDVTNLHVHGVQTVPHLFYPIGTTKLSAPGIAVSPGESFTWDLPIPIDHPAGLYAYHPHHHGSTGTQVMSGAAGALIIRGDVDEVPEIKACREAVIAVNAINLDDANQPPGRYGQNFTPYASPSYFGGDGGYFPFGFKIFTVNGHPVRKFDAPGPGGTLVNEQLAPQSMRVRPGEIVRLRFLNATETNVLRIVAEDGDMRWYAQDGMTFGNLLQTGTGGDNCVFTPPLARSEVLLRAPQKTGEFFITALENIGNTVGGDYSFEGLPETRLMRIVVEGPPKRGMRFPDRLPRPAREYPLIRAEEVTHKRTVRLTRNGTAPQMILGAAFQLNGKSYEDDYAFATTHVGAVEEWTFVNNSFEGHPVHVHVNSMQVESAALSPTQPRLCDVLWVPANSSIKVRMRFKEWSGKAVVHCHIVHHEDQGMMSNVIIKKAPRGGGVSG